MLFIIGVSVQSWIEKMPRPRWELLAARNKKVQDSCQCRKSEKHQKTVLHVIQWLP